MTQQTTADQLDSIAKAIEDGDYAKASSEILVVIEAMSHSDIDSVQSLLRMCALHVFKMMLTPDNHARLHYWDKEMRAFREQIHDALDDSAVLRNKAKLLIPAINRWAKPKAYVKLGMEPPRVITLPDLSMDDMIDDNIVAKIIKENETSEEESDDTE